MNVVVTGQLIGVTSLLPCGPRDQTQVVRVGSKCLYPLGLIANPLTYVFQTIQTKIKH